MQRHLKTFSTLRLIIQIKKLCLNLSSRLSLWEVGIVFKTWATRDKFSLQSQTPLHFPSLDVWYQALQLALIFLSQVWLRLTHCRWIKCTNLAVTIAVALTPISDFSNITLRGWVGNTLFRVIRNRRPCLFLLVFYIQSIAFDCSGLSFLCHILSSGFCWYALPSRVHSMSSWAWISFLVSCLLSMKFHHA